jgi:hypothetical protein
MRKEIEGCSIVQREYKGKRSWVCHVPGTVLLTFRAEPLGPKYYGEDFIPMSIAK